MASAHQGAVLHQLGRLFGRGRVAGLSEWQLLSRYLKERDEVAFEALVARHGPMVLGVCRRLLVDPNDVDDAFQATFLVLVRRATSLGERDAIGHWLYGVAHRVARTVRGGATPLARAQRCGDLRGPRSRRTLNEVKKLKAEGWKLDREILGSPAPAAHGGGFR